jgi:protein-S-isoprenylcysteine O-methyltransferase Ste14
MTFFTPLLTTHVVVAVLGLGSVLSIAVAAATVRKTNGGAAAVSAWLGPLLRFSAVSLVIMLVTGVLMDVSMRGAFQARWWFRGSGLLLLITGALHARARRIVGRELRADHQAEAGLRSIERLAYGMAVLIAAITMLMELKPF